MTYCEKNINKNSKNSIFIPILSLKTPNCFSWTKLILHIKLDGFKLVYHSISLKSIIWMYMTYCEKKVSQKSKTTIFIPILSLEDQYCFNRTKYKKQACPDTLIGYL